MSGTRGCKWRQIICHIYTTHSNIIVETLYSGHLGTNYGCPHFGGLGSTIITDVSSFQGVGIEGFHSLISTVYRGILISGEFHCIQRCPRFRGLE